MKRKTPVGAQRIVGLFAGLLALMGLLAGCAPATAEITIKDAWVRPSTMTVGVTGAFMTIENNGRGDDRLIAASTDVAETVELHETVIANEVMKMQPVAEIVAPAGGEVILKPGSYHIMLLGLTRDVQAGESVHLVLTFRESGEIAVDAEVRQP